MVIQIVRWSEEDYDWDDDFYGLSHSEAFDQAWRLPQTVKLGVSRVYEIIAMAIGQEHVIGAVYGGVKGDTFGMDVIVLPTHRRVGIAKQLIEEAIDHYSELQGYWEDMENEPLIFEVHVVNPILIPYFERLGFTIYDRSGHEVLMRY